MNIYVGNLSHGVTDGELNAVFSEFGEVSSAKVIKDKRSGRSRGYGFVEMPNDSEANEAIKALDDSPLQGRNIRVNQAKPRREPPF
ncbi:MAG: RNA-binding protein [Proteobacteria bacterium]|nr:RNA-binding protein [Pseudomonadota bacterium]